MTQEDVIEQLKLGNTNAPMIAKALGTPTPVVRNHLYRLLEKKVIRLVERTKSKRGSMTQHFALTGKDPQRQTGGPKNPPTSTFWSAELAWSIIMPWREFV